MSGSQLGSMTIGEFEDRPPYSAGLTHYDQHHIFTYLRLLDAADEGADWREVFQIIFGAASAQEPVLARIIYDSHLARARWMTQSGYRHVLKSRSP
jgi:hypothetical protein